MGSPYESADLLLRLYDLRREATMREARNWYFLQVNPSNVDEVMQALTGPHSAYFRMVISYWDMAASLVINGAIDEQMFNDANGEQVGVFAKLEPFLAEHRSKIGSPGYPRQPRKGRAEETRREGNAGCLPPAPRQRGHRKSLTVSANQLRRTFVDADPL